MTRQRDLEFSRRCAARLSDHPEALQHVGHRQTRNRGTFGGSLCHLDPSAELVNLVALYDGILQATNRAGSRPIKMPEWVAGIMTNSLQPDEILAGIDLPIWPPGHGYAFEEFARRHGDFAIAAVSCLIDLAPDGTIKEVALSRRRA